MSFVSKITPETKTLTMEYLGLKNGDKFKLHHWLNENQNMYTDIIFECKNNDIVCNNPDICFENIIFKVCAGNYEIEKICTR